jgi:hypothetical protein
MALAAMGQRFQSEWGTKPSCLAEVIRGLFEANSSIGEYKAQVNGPLAPVSASPTICPESLGTPFLDSFGVADDSYRSSTLPVRRPLSSFVEWAPHHRFVLLSLLRWGRIRSAERVEAHPIYNRFF